MQWRYLDHKSRYPKHHFRFHTSTGLMVLRCARSSLTILPKRGKEAHFPALGSVPTEHRTRSSAQLSVRMLYLLILTKQRLRDALLMDRMWLTLVAKLSAAEKAQYAVYSISQWRNHNADSWVLKAGHCITARKCSPF